MKKRDEGNSPVFNLKDLNSNILYQHFSVKGNVVTRGQNLLDRPEGSILCNSPFSEI